MLCRIIAPILVLFAIGLTANENLVKNPGFENEFKDSSGWSWHGGAFGSGPGKIERIAENPHTGKYCAHLQKYGPGGTQLMSPMMPLGNSKRIAVSLYHRGSPGAVHIGFYHKNGNKYVETLSPLGKHATKYVRLKETLNWEKFSLELDIPDNYLANEGAVRLNIQLWAKQEQTNLYIDEVSITTIAAVPPTILSEEMEITIAPPLTLTTEEKQQFSRIAQGIDFEIKDGLLYRNGKPYYWVGDGCSLGSAQSTPVGLWLAKLQGSTFVSLESGLRFSGKRDGNRISFSFSPVRQAGLHSWLREALRFNILPETLLDTGPFKWSTVRKIAEETPEVKEFLYDAGHGIQIDHNHPLGRKLLELGRSGSAKYTSLTDSVICELYREPGSYPSNQRVRNDFREYAKKKYGSLKAANQVWRRDYKDWSQVQPPHLDSTGILDTSMQLKLRQKVIADSHEMYYDWLRFMQLDYAEGTRKERDDLKKHLPNAPVGIDVRGHRTYTDGYVILDPDLLDDIVDIFFIHQEYKSYDYNNQPADLDTINQQLAYSLFNYNFFKTNSKHPLWDSENIVRTTLLPGSNNEAMKNNDAGQLHGEWQFKFDEQKEGFDREWFKPDINDTQWSKMVVPGCWDETREFGGKSGWAWYRKKFTAKANQQDFLDGSTRYYIYGSGIAQHGTIWLNGHKIGEVKGWNTLYQFDVSTYLKFNQENQITIFVDGTGFHNGLRQYIHILADNQINTAKPFSEKQYASLVWTYMMRGASAVSLWNWTEDVIRPYMASLVDEVNSVTEFVLPSVRKRNGKVAYLYPYLYGRGLPAPAAKDYNDHMNYYNALEFSHFRPDVLSEKNFLSVSPDQYSLAVIPYAKIVFPETYEQIKKYVNDGGTAIVTFGSLEQTFDRYAHTGFHQLAGVEIVGGNTQNELSINDKKFKIETGDETKSKGVNIKPAGATVKYKYPDGTPAITENKYGKGKFIFIAPRLDLYAIHEILKNYLPESGLKITSSEKQEFPHIEAKLTGNAERQLLYLHNWGGLAHELTVTIPQQYSDYTPSNIRGEFVRQKNGSFKVMVPGSAPVALLLEKPGIKPLAIKKFNPARDEILKRLTALNQNGDNTRPKVLFVGKNNRQNTPIGRVLYPNLLDTIDKLGYETHEAKFTQWTPDFLKEFALVVVDETWSNSYRQALKKEMNFAANLVDYVKNGGSLWIMSYSAMTANANASLLRRELTPKFGVELGYGLTFDPKHCNFGDPRQLLTDNMYEHPVTNGVKQIQLYTATPLNIKKDSPLKGVVLTPDGKPIMAAGEFEKGRIFISSDLMWLQPTRIELYDNSRLLVNALCYVLRKNISEPEKQKLIANQFITGKTYQMIESQ